MANTLPIAAAFHLHPLHPACVEIGTLREQLAEAKAQLGRPLVMERGPWAVSDDGRRLYSDDFHHDASLTVAGDFGGDESRKNYADELARRLNRAEPYAMPPELADYLVSHLRQQRHALNGFLALGNEVNRAKRLDDWIASLAGHNG